MQNELEDWQLALLVEARRLDDPAVIDAAEAELYRDHRGLVSEADALAAPVVVEREVAEAYEANEDLIESAQGLTDPVVTERDDQEALEADAEAIKDALGKQLVEHYDLREGVVDAMSVRQMVDQFRDEDEGEVEFENLAQQPETGGAPPEEVDDSPDDGDVDSLSGEDRREFDALRKKHDLMKDRTPEYAESLRADAAEIVGADADDFTWEDY